MEIGQKEIRSRHLINIGQLSGIVGWFNGFLWRCKNGRLELLKMAVVGREWGGESSIMKMIEKLFIFVAVSFLIIVVVFWLLGGDFNVVMSQVLLMWK